MRLDSFKDFGAI